VLQCMLRCILVCCSALQCVAMYVHKVKVGQYVAVYVALYCSVLQRVAVCCSALQCTCTK